MRPLAVRTEATAERDLLASVGRPDGVGWVHRDEGLVGWGEAARIETKGPDRIADARAAFAELAAAASVHDDVGAPGSGMVAFGAFTFDDDSEGSALVVPSVIVGRRNERSWITRIGDEAVEEVAEEANDRVRYAGSTISDIEWLEAVDRAIAALKGGVAEKVVLARDVHVWSKRPFDLRPIARRLAATFPECYTFLIDGLVGATPELLVRRIGSSVESLVLAGSARRGMSAPEDERLGAALLSSVKDGAEHRPAAEEVRRVLAGITRSLETSTEPFLLRLANVQHLATEFRGELEPERDALQIADALHPTPAVCGTPFEPARELIRSLEGMDRGRYAGPVGWMDARGDGEWGIALRCAEFHGARGRLFAGSGIVEASIPEAELEETRLKLRAVESALAAE